MKLSRRLALALLPVSLLAPLPAIASRVSVETPGGDGAHREPGALAMPHEHVPGRALLKLEGIDAVRLALPKARDANAEDALAGIEKRVGVRLVLVRPLLLGWGLFEVRDAAAPDVRPSEAETARLIEVLRDDEAIADATADRWYRALRAPNDPGFADMWHLEAIGAEAAWDLSTGLASQRIGVVDTGSRRNHEDLSGKDVAGYDFISNADQAGDGNGRDGDYTDEGDGANCGGGFVPDSWHGSHVAGTILAATDNGRGIAGINWAAGLVTARALGRCGGALSDIMDAAAWLAGANIQGVAALGADRVSVMNLSLGGPGGCSGYEQDVIDFINGQGVIFVAAAGNDGGAVGSPGNCLGVITVAAHGPGANRPLTAYSSFGSSVEIVAPGGAIQQSFDQGVLSLSGPDVDAYTWQQGTSMAAPHVAGAISLMLSLDPTLTRAEVSALLQENGVDCQGCQGRRALRIDAVLAAMGVSEPVEPEPVPEPPADDELEENDSFAEASPVACGASLELFAGTGDLDWLTLSPEAGVELSVVLDGGAQDLDLYLTDGPSNGDVLAASTSETGQESVAFVAPGGAIALVIAPWEQASGTYTLSISCVEPTEPEPTEPEPTEPEPTEPEPTEPEPTEPEPTEPTEPEPTEPEPTEPEPTEPEPREDRVNDITSGPSFAASGGCHQGGGAAGGFPVVGVLLLGLWLRRRSGARAR